MAKKRGKVFRRQADRSWKELKPRKPKPRSKQSRKQRQAVQIGMLRHIIREATKTGAAEAIEHCANFWSVSDGYQKYIDYQVKAQAEALMAAVKTALREELQRRDILAQRDAIARGYERARRKPKP